MLVLIAKGILRLLSWLPAGGPWWLANKLAPLWMKLSPTKRNTTYRNLERCFPEMSEDDRDALARESFVHYVATVLEAGHNWYWPLDKIMAQSNENPGLSLLEKGLERGRGVLVLVPHFGAWEYLGVNLQRYSTIGILYKPPEDPRMDRALSERRSRGGALTFPANARGVRALFGHLQTGHGVGVLPDQDPSEGQGRFVPFFGVPALTGVLVPRIARRTDCTVVFGAAERLPGGKFRIHITESDPAIADPDLDVALTALNRGIEKVIEIAPAQYLWSYKRFKSRPEGEPRFYG